MAQRRSVFNAMMPASMLTPKGGSQTMHGDPDGDNDQSMEMSESPDSFRRRTTPIMGQVEKRPTTLQEVLAMLNGGQ
jgi:hypothetical protein